MKKLLLLVTVVLLGSAAAWAQDPLTPSLGQSTTFKVTPANEDNSKTHTTTFFIVGGGSTDIGLSSTNLIAHSKLDSSPATTGDFTVTEGLAKDGGGAEIQGVFAATVSSGVHSLNVTWNGESASKSFYVFAETTDGCAKNYTAWKVNPAAATWYITNVQLAKADGTVFKLDGVSLLDEGICPSNNITTTWATNGTTTDHEFTYKYGTSYMYIAVTAEGFDTSTGGTWTPQITLVDRGQAKAGDLYLDGSSTIIPIQEYDVADVTYSTNLTTDPDYTTALSTPTTASTIYIRIPIVNNTYKSLVSEEFTIYVDGVDGDNVVDGAKNVVTPNAFENTINDVINQKITARPEMSTLSGTID